MKHLRHVQCPFNPRVLPAILAVLGLTLFATAAHAFSFQPTKMQYYLMPEHCQAKMSDFHRNREGGWKIRFPVNEAKIAHWRAIIGPDWEHMHHYCAGLAYLSMAENASASDRRTLYGRAHQEIDYTRSRSRVGAPLWGKMTLDYARAKEGVGARAEAIDLLAQLLQQSPDNVHVYVALAQALHRGGDLEQAIAILEQGMEQAKDKAPVLFYLPRYYYEFGDIERAAALLPKAEQAGMKMDSLREKLGSAIAPAAGRGAATAASD